MGLREFQDTSFGARIHSSSATTILPGVSWNGTAGSGGTASGEDGTLRGAGWPHQAIAAFDEPKVTFMAADLAITVGAEHGDTSWIGSVQFWLEGSTATVTTVTKNPRTGSVGFVITVPFTSVPQDGDMLMYAYVNPVNGYQRRVGPITITRMADANRPVRYIDPAGADTNNGLAVGTPWKTILKASTTAPSGSIVWMANGSYVEDSNAGTLQTNARHIEFRSTSGVAANVIVTRTSRAGATQANWWQPRCMNFWFTNVTIDVGKIANPWGPSATGCYVYKGCVITDTNGIDGGNDHWAGVTPSHPSLTAGNVQIGYQINTELLQTPWRSTEGQQNCVLESSISMPCGGSGLRLMRNTTLNHSADAVFMTNLPPPACFNLTISQDLADFEQRRHLAHTLTVATVSYVAGTVTNPDGVVVPGKTTITWSEGTIYDSVTAGGQPFQNFRFLTGALVGQEFSIYSQTTGGTTVLYGDCRAAVVGDSARGYIVFHSDAFQQGTQAKTSVNNDNIFVQNSKITGHDLQILWQGGTYTGNGTITTVGTALTCSVAHNLQGRDVVRLSAGAQKWQYRFVDSVTDSTHAVLSDPFTVDQTSQTWWQGKTIRAFAFQNCIFDCNRDTPFFVKWQWQAGQAHGVVRQCTMVGQEINLRTDTAGGFGTWGCAVLDSIIERIDLGSGSAAPADYGFAPDGNHIVSTGTSIDVPGTNFDTGAVTYDASYNPTSGVTRHAAQLKIPFNYAGSALVFGTALVGARG